jgi:hypothetical protein
MVMQDARDQSDAAALTDRAGPEGPVKVSEAARPATASFNDGSRGQSSPEAAPVEGMITVWWEYIVVPDRGGTYTG